MIQLTDPENNKREFDPGSIILIFYSKFLGPAKAKSNIIYRGQIISLREKPEEVVKIVGSTIKMIELTLPEGGVASAKGSSWFNAKAILEVRKNGTGASVKLSGQKGVVEVRETKEQVEALLKAAA